MKCLGLVKKDCVPRCVQIFHLGRYTEVFEPKKNGLDLLVDLAGSERIRL